MTTPVTIKTQPNDETCGPTSLHAVYNYFGYDFPLMSLIDEVASIPSGGTITPNLGIHALENDFSALIYVYNINIFDPTWFFPKPLSMQQLKDRLHQQTQYKQDRRLLEATQKYIDFIDRGGEIVYHDLTKDVFKLYFSKKLPIITALSATYLYQTAREIDVGNGKAAYHDLKGSPTGHFVVLCDYDDKNRRIIVADPHRENPISNDNYYKVSSRRLINAIMLGVLTFDANLLIIQPNRQANETHHR